jgi:eukaryotic-like serine/threonine-protein kinase
MASHYTLGEMANSPARQTIGVGSEIAGTYKIEALLGQGGMGSVFLASHNRLPGKRVAIKLLHAEIADPEILRRFEREAHIASRLGHPNIVTVLDFNVTADGTPYLVLEYLQGQSLAERIAYGPMPIEQIMSVVRQVGSALAAAHREGIIHRDLKPGNIFLVPTHLDGHVVEVAKVLDFGISKMRGSSTVKTQESTLLGTPQYMAPEQAKGAHDIVDQRTDVFALGTIVYEMLSGKPPFNGASIPEVVFKVVYEEPAKLEGIAPELVAAVMQAMAKAPAERFASVGAFVQAFTGQPLSQFKVPVPTLVGGSGAAWNEAPGADSRPRHTGHEAFANTMGSHDSQPPVVGQPTAQPDAGATRSLRSPEPVPPNQPTVESLPPNETRLPAPPTQRRRSPLVFVVAALGVAALTAGALFVVLRDDESKPAPTPPVTPQPAVVDAAVPIPVVVADAPVAVTDATQVAEVPADAAGKRPPKPTPTPTPPKPTPTPPPPPSTDDGEDGSPEIRAQLQEARRAVNQGDFAKATKIANQIVNSPDPSDPRVLAQAYAIRGMVACLKDESEGSAQIALRQIGAFPKFPRIRMQVLNACHSKGLLAEVPR